VQQHGSTSSEGSRRWRERRLRLLRELPVCAAGLQGRTCASCEGPVPNRRSGGALPKAQPTATSSQAPSSRHVAHLLSCQAPPTPPPAAYRDPLQPGPSSAAAPRPWPCNIAALHSSPPASPAPPAARRPIHRRRCWLLFRRNFPAAGPGPWQAAGPSAFGHPSYLHTGLESRRQWSHASAPLLPRRKSVLSHVTQRAPAKSLDTESSSRVT
jgi:hypothetical protein